MSKFFSISNPPKNDKEEIKGEDLIDRDYKHPSLIDVLNRYGGVPPDEYLTEDDAEIDDMTIKDLKNADIDDVREYVNDAMNVVDKYNFYEAQKKKKKKKDVSDVEDLKKEEKKSSENVE